MNCWIAPNFIGPLQITGLSGSSIRNAMDMTLMPSGPMAGKICPSSTCNSASSNPIIFGMLGPVMSISIMPTDIPLRARVSASPAETVDLPTPPLPERTMILCLMDLSICSMRIFLRICAYACSICAVCSDVAEFSSSLGGEFPE